MKKETPFRLEGGGCDVNVRCGLTALRLPSNRLQLLALNKDEELYNNDYTEEEGQVDHVCVWLQNGWKYSLTGGCCQIRWMVATDLAIALRGVVKPTICEYWSKYAALCHIQRRRSSS